MTRRRVNVHRVLLINLLLGLWLAGACGLSNSTPAPTAPVRSPEQSDNTRSPEQPPDAAPPAPDAQSCDSSKVRWAIGQRASDDLLERAREEAGARTARFLQAGQPITMEYLGSRLNLELNAEKVVRTVRCG